MFFRLNAWLVLCFSCSLQAQVGSVYSIENQVDSIITYPDTVLLMESSLRLVNQRGDTMAFAHAPAERKIRVLGWQPGDSLTLAARILPLLSRPVIRILDSAIRKEALPPDYAREWLAVGSANRNWWDSPGVNFTGNFSRSLSAGNNQSLVLNSALNLQMSGDLGDNIRLVGAISDNQIPIQPEGNTRQIQDFDKLFIQISRNNLQFTAGDYELQRPMGYFMNYFKKTKGGLFESKHHLGNWSVSNKMGFAISKGKNQRINLETQNGNQGPYRLRGRDNESFIIVLAGSEKVWIDGVLMTRGDDADYVMDYNLGEITFTPRRIISDQTRVIVEFEYAVQNYIRTLSVGHLQATNKNWQTYVNVFAERDSRRPTVNADLDSLDKAILRQSGDDPALAVRSGIRRSGADFNSNRIYYHYRDTSFYFQSHLVAARVLMFSEKPDSNSLQVGFSELPNGNYRLKLSSANGRVYEWVAPDPITGIGQGQFEPILPIPAPQQNLLINTGIAWAGHRGAMITAETAMSLNDKNRLSDIQDEDNVGAALRIQAKSPRLEVYKNILAVQFYSELECNDARFQAINPYRSAEFIRDWNVSSFNGFKDRIVNGGSNLFFGKHLSASYDITVFDRDAYLTGWKHHSQILWNDSVQRVALRWNLLVTTGDVERSRFDRPSIEWTRKWGNGLSLHTRAFREKNERFASQSGVLRSVSFHFDQWENHIAYSNDEHFTAKLRYQLRKDYLADSTRFKAHSLAQEFSIQTTLPQTRLGSFDVQIGGRKVDFDNKKLHDSLRSLYFLGLLDHQVFLWKQAVRIKNYYELQSGVEPRQEFVFEEQRHGQGNYIYRDFNGDGIRQVQEYIYAPDIDTANFVRLQLFNTDYVPVYQNTWNQFVIIDLNRLIKSKDRNWRLVRKLSFESNFRLNNKLDYNSLTADRLNPLVYIQKKQSLLAFQRNGLHQIFFNRASPKYELHFAHNTGNVRSLLTSGNDERNTEEWSQKLRITFFKKLDASIQTSIKSEGRFAPLYFGQNYQLQSQRWEAGIQYRINPEFRAQVTLIRRHIEETQYGGERAKIWQWVAAGQGVAWKKFSLRSELKWFKINFEGMRGSAVEFVMLDGFKHGHNAMWEVQAEYKLSKTVQIQLSYNGRKAAGLSPIHTGRAQLRANF